MRSFRDILLSRLFLYTLYKLRGAFSRVAGNHASYMRRAFKIYQWIKSACFRLVFPHPRSPLYFTHVNTSSPRTSVSFCQSSNTATFHCIGQHIIHAQPHTWNFPMSFLLLSNLFSAYGYAHFTQAFYYSVLDLT